MYTYLLQIIIEREREGRGARVIANTVLIDVQEMCILRWLTIKWMLIAQAMKGTIAGCSGARCAVGQVGGSTKKVRRRKQQSTMHLRKRMNIHGHFSAELWIWITNKKGHTCADNVVGSAAQTVPLALHSECVMKLYESPSEREKNEISREDSFVHSHKRHPIDRLPVRHFTS